MTQAPMSERVFDMRESGKSTAEIAAFFNLDVTDVNRMIHRVRKRRAKKVAEVDA
jgi:DNA-directed RNA polymerase specialized sigma24 family protein